MFQPAPVETMHFAVREETALVYNFHQRNRSLSRIRSEPPQKKIPFHCILYRFLAVPFIVGICKTRLAQIAKEKKIKSGVIMPA